MQHSHFVGRFEVELKFRLTSRTDFLACLAQQEHHIRFIDNIEHDVYFDDAQRELATANKSLCIRRITPADINLWIVKGPGESECQAVDISDYAKAQEMLKGMGFEPVLSYRKRRSIYFIDAYHLTLDNIAGLGDFAEFAIMTSDETKLADYRHALWALARKFNLGEAQLINQSYLSMMLALQLEQVSQHCN
ncbi:MAG: class IV adenylate cyclase [Shewanella sp.]